jgi:hypothetical protein
MPRKRERAVFELPVVYCRDNAEVQNFVNDRVWNFSPYAVPETMRDVFESARREFGDWNCFYLQIQPH